MTPFDVDEYLAQPLTARVATDGPTVRPTWYLWEDHTFWILSGQWSHLPAHVRASPRLALTVDVCDLATGLVRQVVASGPAAVVAFDVPRGRRKLVRYLGPDEQRWDPRFRAYLNEAERGTVWVRLTPETLRAKDLSYEVNAAAEPPAV
ncbi:pyridoxamine 5'-phosphate oxidase family protein [Amycolatopsis sp. DSM 110486]|uniref:pyridoxamine 5'-phosphate oxidase family protein n=1 Tax=Amycolatopsis sp. DSM 110486 TaxID=2865832 RepID=UPI001C6A85C3|nr:pyridoxamine 5'-phosphate oxidase family protein [Amycolatopsis sp. DSM 110486]QYN22751.1 pyridoxamine 5'-phosphate oxidase family protein [Amycolatopsis sp. DSM 110486]